MSPTASRVLTTVVRFTAEHGRAPAYKEIARALGYATNGSISRALGELRRAGAITTGIIPTTWSQRCTCPHCGGDLRKGPAP